MFILNSPCPGMEVSRASEAVTPHLQVFCRSIRHMLAFKCASFGRKVSFRLLGLWSDNVPCQPSSCLRAEWGMLSVWGRTGASLSGKLFDPCFFVAETMVHPLSSQSSFHWQCLLACALGLLGSLHRCAGFPLPVAWPLPSSRAQGCQLYYPFSAEWLTQGCEFKSDMSAI